MGLDLRLANLDPTQSLDDLREPPIEAEKGGAAIGSCQMKRIREVHLCGHPVQGRRGQSGILQRHPREPYQGPKGFADLGRRIAIGTAQDLFGLQQDGRGDENLMAVDQRSCPRRLLRVVAGQVPATTLGSIASMAPPGFSDYTSFHLFKRLRRPRRRQGSVHILQPGGSKQRGSLQEHTLRCVFDHQTRSRLPASLLPDRFGKNDLALGGDSRGQPSGLCHLGLSKVRQSKIAMSLGWRKSASHEAESSAATRPNRLGAGRRQ